MCCVCHHSVYDPGRLKWCFLHAHTCPAFYLYHFATCLIVCRVGIPKRHAQTRTHVYTERVKPCCCVGFLFQEIPLSNRQEFKGAPSWHASWDNERLCLGLDCWLRIILQDKQATVRPRGHTWSTAQWNRWSQSSQRRPSCCLHFLSDRNLSQTMKFCCMQIPTASTNVTISTFFDVSWVFYLFYLIYLNTLIVQLL